MMVVDKEEEEDRHSDRKGILDVAIVVYALSGASCSGDG
jgi:hypothetical protein